MTRFQYGNTRPGSGRHIRNLRNAEIDYALALAVQQVREAAKPDLDCIEAESAGAALMVCLFMPNRLKGVTVNSRGEAV